MYSIVLLFAAVFLVITVFELRRREARPVIIATTGALLIAALAAFFSITVAYDLRKLVAALVMPVGLMWIGLGALAIAVSRLGRRRLAAGAWLLWLAYSVCGNGWVGRGLMVWLEGEYADVDALSLPAFDAVLVLGGSVAVHDSGQLYLGSSGDRAVLGARLYLAGMADHLITSGPFEPRGEGSESVPVITSRFWQELGVDKDRIILLEGPRSTSEEVADFARLVRSHSWRRIGLVTSASHLRRAERLCTKNGLEVAPLPTDFHSTRYPLRVSGLIPNAGGFLTVHSACWEIVGAAVGR